MEHRQARNGRLETRDPIAAKGADVNRGKIRPAKCDAGKPGRDFPATIQHQVGGSFVLGKGGQQFFAGRAAIVVLKNDFQITLRRYCKHSISKERGLCKSC